MSYEPSVEPRDADVVAEDEVETVDGVLVLNDDAILTPASLRPGAALAPAASPAVTVAAAATGFVAGAATLALVRRRSARRTSRSAVSRRVSEALPIVGTRSFLVDVHLIGGSSQK